MCSFGATASLARGLTWTSPMNLSSFLHPSLVAMSSIQTQQSRPSAVGWVQMLQSILTEICLCGGKIGLSVLALAISKTSISLSRSALAARSKKSVLVWSTQLFCANLGHKYWAVYVLGTKFKFLWKFNTRFLKLVLLCWFVSASLVTKIYFLFFNHIDVI